MCDLKSYRKKSFLPRFIAVIVLLNFLFFTIIPPGYAQNIQLPTVGTLVPLSPVFQPAVLRGIQVDPFKHLELKFIVDAGESGLTGEDLQSETNSLIHYFLASLAIPEKDLWVNLSPYEGDRVVPDALGKTEMGRDLLAQDYLLKQVTASLLYPDDELGKQFWQRVYKKAYEKYGTTNIPVNTFNKVWILPDTVKIYEEGDRAIITEAKMKVMLEEDYLSKEKNLKADAQGKADETAQLSSEIIREIVIPEIEREVNEGKNFAKVRQVYYSLVLAHWFKTKLKNVLMNKIFADLSKTKGFETNDPEVIDKIYDQYVESFKKGVCNVLRIDFDKNENKHIPRKYFSGGTTFVLGKKVGPDTAASAITVLRKAATLATAVVFFAFASLSGKAATPEDLGGKANTIEATLNPTTAPAFVAGEGDFKLDGPPNLSPQGDTMDPSNPNPAGQQAVQSNPNATGTGGQQQAGQTYIQMFGKTVPVLTNGFIMQSANNPNANLTITNLVTVSLPNSLTGMSVAVNLFEAEVVIDGVQYTMYGSELQSPDPGFNFGHMTASHVYQALKKSFETDAGMRASIMQVMGMTDEVDALKELERQYASARIGWDITAPQPAFMNERGMSRPWTQMAAGAVYFALTSDGHRVPVFFNPLKALDPGQIPLADIPPMLSEYPSPNFVYLDTQVHVMFGGGMVTFATASDAGLKELLRDSRRIGISLATGKTKDLEAKGVSALNQFGVNIDNAAGDASKFTDGVISGAQGEASNFLENDTIAGNILNIVSPGFLAKTGSAAQDLTSGIVEGARKDAQNIFNQFAGKFGQNATNLGILGGVSELAESSFVQGQVDSFFEGMAKNFSMRSGPNSFEVGTNTNIANVVTEMANAKVEVSYKNTKGETTTIFLTAREVASLRYAAAAGFNAKAVGGIGDSGAGNLIIQMFNQAKGPTFNEVSNTPYGDLPVYSDPILEQMANELYNSQSTFYGSGQLDFNVFANLFAGGFDTFAAELGVGFQVKGVPIIVTTYMGGGAYGFAKATMDITSNVGVGGSVSHQSGNVSGQGYATAEVKGGGEIRLNSLTTGFGGVEITFPKGYSVTIQYGESQTTQIRNYALGDASIKFETATGGNVNVNISADIEAGIGRELTTVKVDNTFQFNPANMLRDAFNDPGIKGLLDQYVSGQGYQSILEYLNSADLASAWNNYVPGSISPEEGVYNFLNGIDQQYGFEEFFSLIENLWEDSGSADSFDNFKKDFLENLGAQWKEILKGPQEAINAGTSKENRDLVETVRNASFVVRMSKYFGYGSEDLGGFTRINANIGGEQTGVDVTTGVTGRAGPVRYSGSVKLSGGTIGEAASLKLQTGLLGYGIEGKGFTRLVADVDEVLSRPRFGSFYEQFAVVGDQLELYHPEVDSTAKVFVLGTLLNNTMGETYGFDLSALNPNAAALIKVGVEKGRFGVSGSFRTYFEGNKLASSYFRFGATMGWGPEQMERLFSLGVLFDPNLGVPNGFDATLNVGKASFFTAIENGAARLGFKGPLEDVINVFKKSPGRIVIKSDRDGDIIYSEKIDPKGRPLLDYLDYVPSSGQGEREGMTREEALDTIAKSIIQEAIDEADTTSETNGPNKGPSVKGAEFGEKENAEPASPGTGAAGSTPTEGQSGKKFIKGGIAFDSRKIDMQIEGTGLQFDFPDSLITDEMRNLMGLVPHIINFTPVTNPISLFGPLAKVQE